MARSPIRLFRQAQAGLLDALEARNPADIERFRHMAALSLTQPRTAPGSRNRIRLDAVLLGPQGVEPALPDLVDAGVIIEDHDRAAGRLISSSDTNQTGGRAWGSLMATVVPLPGSDSMLKDPPHA